MKKITLYRDPKGETSSPATEENTDNLSVNAEETKTVSGEETPLEKKEDDFIADLH